MVDLSSISSGLKLGKDGIWYTDEKTAISYPDEGNRMCYAVEDKSFWFRHRNACIVESIKMFPPKDNGPIFDIGGGNGFVSLAISDAGFKVVLVEPGIDGVRNAKKRGVRHIVCTSLENAGFVPKSIPAIGLFDVLEHIEDDKAFLRSIKSLLMDRGKLYLTVPAHPFLWSNEDTLSEHFRRYTIPSLSKELIEAGFCVDYATTIFGFFPVPIFLFRTIPFKLGFRKETLNAGDVSRGHVVNSAALLRLLESAFNREISNIRKKAPMRFGGSCLVVASSP
ncbi:MAG: class I SAM-dependent methyltransferase [bacterium]